MGAFSLIVVINLLNRLYVTFVLNKVSAFEMSFCEMPSKTKDGKQGKSTVIHLRESDLGPPSEKMVNFARQPTVEEAKYNKDSVHDLNWSCFCVDSSIGPCGRFFRTWENLCVYAKRESDGSKPPKSKIHEIKSKNAPKYDEEKCLSSFRDFMACTMANPEIRPWAAALKKHNIKNSNTSEKVDSS